MALREPNRPAHLRPVLARHGPPHGHDDEHAQAHAALAPHGGRYESILEAIGHTPMIRLGRVTRGIRTPVLAKAEQLNPGDAVAQRYLNLIQEE